MPQGERFVPLAVQRVSIHHGGMPRQHILAIDQGTTSTRAMLFDREGRTVSVARRELLQHYPASGWVEHDPEEIWSAVVATAREALETGGSSSGEIAGIGIANQRETVVLWDRATGEAIHNAIVWQDRRTADRCAALKDQGLEREVNARTGLLLDPYFSATKIAWLLDHVPGARARAERGELAVGTIDCFILWRLTGGKVHATDVTNASRTMLWNIHEQCWDDELCRLFQVPVSLLPEVRDNSCRLGVTERTLLGKSLPIGGMAGDQQAALFGQACFEPGMVKSTYGTGCFLLMNTGDRAIASDKGLLTTPAYRLDGKIRYAVEGSIFSAGSAVKWLRDGLGVIAHASDTDSLATNVPDSHGVYLVPAFAGLGAPHWDPDARGAIFGLTYDATAAHVARAALESVAFQTYDLMRSMGAGADRERGVLRVDGGMAANRWFCQFLADILEVRVERPRNLETTALGAAYLAGLATGVWTGLDDLASRWSPQDHFEPRMQPQLRRQLLEGWHDAVSRTLSRRDLS